jgi:hypothetical protein
VSESIPQSDALFLQLAMFRGNEPDGGLLEVRYRRPGGCVRRLGFFSARDLRRLAAEIERVACRADVWVGVNPRREVYRISDRQQSGGNDAIERCWTLHVDCDTEASCAEVPTFVPMAAVIVCSGRGLHAYWPLRCPLTPEQAKRANRRLAHRLGADMAATDAARIMRPAATLNFKHDPPRSVVCERLEVVSYSPAEVVRDLPDPPTPSPSAPTCRSPRQASDDPSRILAGLICTVAEAQDGNRNSALFWAACRVLEHAEEGVLGAHEGLREIRDAAGRAGLPELEIERTLQSAIDTGAMVAA